MSMRSSRHSKVGRALGASAALSVLLVALAACTGSSTPAPTQTPVPPTATTAPVASVDPGKLSPTDLPAYPTVANAQGAIKDLALGECRVEAGEQTVTGTITSSAPGTADYVVVIDWVNATSDVRGRAVAVLKAVKVGEKREFTAKATVASGAVSCIPNVRYGKA